VAQDGTVWWGSGWWHASWWDTNWWVAVNSALSSPKRFHRRVGIIQSFNTTVSIVRDVQTEVER
jgi:hypothetical protein